MIDPSLLREHVQHKAEELAASVQKTADTLLGEVETFKKDMLEEIDKAVQNELHSVLLDITKRLERIETRLPDEEAT